MYKMLFGMMAGIALTLAATQVYQANKPAAPTRAVQSPLPASDSLETASLQIATIATQLATLQSSVDALYEIIDNVTLVSSYADDTATRSDPVAVPLTGDTPDPGVLLSQKQAVLSRLDDPGLTLPDLMASAELAQLPPDAQDQVMQEFVRRFNNNEINREQFIPGYKYQ